MTMPGRYLYTLNGTPAYQIDDEGNKDPLQETFESRVFEITSWRWSFYIRDDVVYERDGQARFWIADNYLYEYGTGRSRFYISDDGEDQTQEHEHEHEHDGAA